MSSRTFGDHTDQILFDFVERVDRRALIRTTPAVSNDLKARPVVAAATAPSAAPSLTTSRTEFTLMHFVRETSGPAGTDLLSLMLVLGGHLALRIIVALI